MCFTCGVLRNVELVTLLPLHILLEADMLRWTWKKGLKEKQIAKGYKLRAMTTASPFG